MTGSAVMKQGGYLEQYDTPAKVLGEPASDFVAEFVGADRLLKLMAVVDVGDSDPEPPARHRSAGDQRRHDPCGKHR